ncbi:metal ABC transporter permease [Vagococcus xieshaowenii]|uniref:Metal ABC transporter permease n=1 Tax=Vagococcus xieshaowenii TaxID=2562451 RepID=A0A4Z0D2Y5_9ENTE|nr:metal ABC transporter permease [Vagococcus xieshaowenii]QCA28067.1 metal ABC transporter permease [Vagococcus xieshaowenii]TFZ40110.1 metal ABC transporter permease [Vagococcus xieshaowenii]
MEMFSYPFMRMALMATVLMAIIAPMLGVFLVIRRQSLLADTLSHVSLAGVALGFLINVNPTLTTFLVVVVAACLLEYLRMMYQTYSEVSTAILMSGGLALALIIMSFSEGSSGVKINEYLFGSIVTINQSQLVILAVLAVVLIVAYSLFRRPMYVLTFDEDTAHVDGLPVTLMSVLFNVLTGIAISVMIPIAGALLISAIMVLPAAIAMRIGRSFQQVIVVSVVVGLVGMLSGLVTSYQLDTPAGATITMLFIVIFMVVNVMKFLTTKFNKK